MGLTWTVDDRRQISKLLVQLPLEISSLENTMVVSAQHQASYSGDDIANKKFFDNFHIDIASKYELERQLIDGATAGTFAEVDIQNSAQLLPGNKFFPDPNVGPPPVYYLYDIPKIIDEVNGNPVISTDENEGMDRLFWIKYKTAITAGFAEVPAASGPATYAVGSHLIMVTENQPFAQGHYGVCYGSGHSFYYKITGVTHGGTDPNFWTRLDIIELTIAGGNITGTAANSFSGFTNAERESMTASSAVYQELLDGLAGLIDTQTATWEARLDNQHDALDNNDDDRAIQIGEIVTAKNDITGAKVIIDAWQVLPYSGVTGRFTDAAFSIISPEITARAAFCSVRVPQIPVALGSVIDGGDGSYSGSNGDIYYERYKWLDIRLNRLSGSAFKFYAMDRNGTGFQKIVDHQNTILSRYTPYFKAMRIVEPIKGTNPVTVSSSTDFNVGDGVYIVSDDQAEFETTISLIDGNNVSLETPIPVIYTIAKFARIFKEL